MIYELNYLVGESKDAELEKIKQDVEKIVVGAGAQFLESQFIEKRKLAYKVGKDVRGTYVAQRFEIPEKNSEEIEEAAEKENAIKQITKKLNLNQNILRFIIVKADELPELGKKEPLELPAKEPIISKTSTGKKPIEKKTENPEVNIDKKLDELLNI